jgi:hypothetical protein
MVKITLQALCLSLFSYAIASPLATTDAEAVEAIAIEKRIPSNRCEYRFDGSETFFTVWMAGWGNNDGTSLSGCGTGLLDNLRGQCGNVVDWGCDEIRENPHDTKVHFTLPGRSGPNPYCVSEAIRRASWGGSVNIGCSSV